MLCKLKKLVTSSFKVAKKYITLAVQFMILIPPIFGTHV